jgi:hypothetical protein
VNGMRKSGERYRRRHQRNVGRVLSSHKGSLREIHQADVARRGACERGTAVPKPAHPPGGAKKWFRQVSQRGAARDMLYLGKNIRELFPQKENFMLKLLWKPISYLSNV